MTASERPTADAAVPPQGAVTETAADGAQAGGQPSADGKQPGAATQSDQAKVGDPTGTPSDRPPSGVTADAPPVGAQTTAPADYPPSTQAGKGLFGVSGTGDTSGFGGLMRRRSAVIDAPRPLGGYFDEVVDALEEAYPGFHDAIEKVIVDRGELTLHITPERIAEVCQTMRDDPALRFELCSSVSGVDYLGHDDKRLHIVYQLTSLTFRRRIRLECAVTAEEAHLPSVTKVYPTADWQEREAYDMFGVVFDGHPNLTRILMPDDWEGHPQRKDYPLGGVPVEYKGAEIPPPDERRTYQ
jgi:NADH-quinone oxidoreductase subunit C